MWIAELLNHVSSICRQTRTRAELPSTRAQNGQGRSQHPDEVPKCKGNISVARDDTHEKNGPNPKNNQRHLPCGIPARPPPMLGRANQPPT